MTPKEKAKELVDKFLKHNTVWIDDENYYYSEKKSKQCALIAVDEILNVIPYSIMDTHKGEVYFYENDERNYFEEVKKEIEKL